MFTEAMNLTCHPPALCLMALSPFSPSKCPGPCRFGCVADNKSCLLILLKCLRGLFFKLCVVIFKFACMGKFLWSYRFVHILPVLPLDKPAILDWLNLILNLNQARGPYQLSWTLTFRVSTSKLNLYISTGSLIFVPQLGPSTGSLNLVPQLGPSTESLNLVPQLSPSTVSLNLRSWELP